MAVTLLHCVRVGSHFRSVFLVVCVRGCLQASVDTIMKEKMPKKGGRWWFSWRSRNSDSKSVSRLVRRGRAPHFFPHRITFDLCVCLGIRIGGRRSLRGEHVLCEQVRPQIHAFLSRRFTFLGVIPYRRVVFSPQDEGRVFLQ